MGISGIGRFVAYTPYVVVSGFMSGIGIIMIVIQILPFSRRARGAGRTAGDDSRVARGGGQYQWQRVCPRRLDSGGCVGLAPPPGDTAARSPSGPDYRHPGGPAVARRRPRRRTRAWRFAGTAVDVPLRRLYCGCPPTGDHSCPARLREQPSHFPGRRFPHWRTPQSQPGTGGSGNRQHGRGIHGRPAWSRGHHGNRHQHTGRRPDPGIGSLFRGGPAGVSIGSWPIRRADSPRRSRRPPDQGRLGHRRLESSRPDSPHPARTHGGHAAHAGPDGVRRPRDRHRHRADRRGNDSRSAVGTPGDGQRGIGAAAGPDLLCPSQGTVRIGPLSGASRPVGAQGQLYRRLLQPIGPRDQRRHQGSRCRHFRLLSGHVFRRQRGHGDQEADGHRSGRAD